MKRPDLRHALVLEAPETSPDGAGGWSESWAALGTLWADISARTGRDARGEMAGLSVAPYRIVVRAALAPRTNVSEPTSAADPFASKIMCRGWISCSR